MNHHEDPEALIDGLRPRLEGILERYQIPLTDRDDVLNEAYLVLRWRYERERVRDPESWLVITLKNRCLIYWRSRRRPAREFLESSGAAPLGLAAGFPPSSANDSMPGLQTAASRARKILGALELVLPRRITNEEIGDCLETIEKLRELRRPAWAVYTKIASTIFWTLINTCRELTGAFLGRKRA